MGVDRVNKECAWPRTVTAIPFTVPKHILYHSWLIFAQNKRPYGFRTASQKGTNYVLSLT